MLDPAFDLDAYLRRIAYAGPRVPTLGALTALCAGQPAAIAFENIDPLLGKVPSLAIEALQAKLVGGRRGGYCFEQNALLRQALLAFGFRVTSLAARVVWMAPPDAPARPRTHMLLRVDLPDGPPGPFIADAGFGGHLLGVPLRLVPGVARPTLGGRQRLTQVADEYTLETELPQGWAPQYRFTLEPQLPADYEPLNWFTATRPSGLFRHNLVVERLTPALRANLLNDRLTLRMPGRAPQERRLTTADELARVLDAVFDLRPEVSAAEVFAVVPKELDGIFVPA